MKKLDELLLGLSFKCKYLKKELFKNNKMFKIILIPYLLLTLFVGHQLFFRMDIINFLGSILSIIFMLLYTLSIYTLTKMILVEFGIIKKSKLDSKFLNTSKQQFESSKKKHFKPNEITKLQDEVSLFKEKQYTFIDKLEFEPIKVLTNKNTSEISILNKRASNNIESIKSIENDLIKVNKNHTDFVTHEYEPTRNLVKKNTKRTTIIEEQIFIKEKIKSHCSIEEIKSLFLEYKKDLFENLDVHNFVKYMFEGNSKISENILYEDEINNILAIMTLLIQEGKINNNNSVLFRLMKPYLKLDIKIKMFGINIKNKKYSITNDNTESYIIDQITNFKII